MLVHHDLHYGLWLEKDRTGTVYEGLSTSPIGRKVTFALIYQGFRQLLLALTENYRDIHCSWLSPCLSQLSAFSHRLER